MVAATTKFGDLRESNLSFLRADRLKVLGVMTALMEAAGIPAGEWSRNPQFRQPGAFAYLVERLGVPPQVAEEVGQMFRGASEEDL